MNFYLNQNFENLIFQIKILEQSLSINLLNVIFWKKIPFSLKAFVQREIVLLETFEAIIENILEFDLPFLELKIQTRKQFKIKSINFKFLNQLKFNYICITLNKPKKLEKKRVEPLIGLF
ncbi:hypothetical protein BpHYR1_024276 [Brachionus plicatilis]|uniref:Uncharacterized protein n=1 Tax=Brachionus plicatilis TaxID=10195 RepID=A0A3M7SEN0_BRAPC|nr:hypothetical protein BpHYR1_024276 [Brachionus plicatilis]